MSITMAKPKKLRGGIESANDKPVVLPAAQKKNRPTGSTIISSISGSERYYLNMEVPQRFIDRVHQGRSAKAMQVERKKIMVQGTCSQCGHAYSHVINNPGVCPECRIDDLATAAEVLEQAGINLGWGFSEHTRDYERESHNVSRRAIIRHDCSNK